MVPKTLDGHAWLAEDWHRGVSPYEDMQVILPLEK
jgi:hypothetical protein